LEKGVPFLLASFSPVLSFHREARFHHVFRLTFLYNFNHNSFFLEACRGINAVSISITISYSIQTAKGRERERERERHNTIKENNKDREENRETMLLPSFPFCLNNK
jgi:hypothetical protein